MVSMPIHKYKPFPAIDLRDRRWPGRVIERAPRWCSVDLRDGNQALVEPMGPERKRRLFELLVRLGFKEIEVGFPAASQTDFEFVRRLVVERLVPDDVTIGVLTQAREDLIDRTFEALAGAPRACVHLYNSTSALQRRIVVGLDRAGIIDIATAGASRCKWNAARAPETDFAFEYSPESFTATELDFARDICEAVMDVWEPSSSRKVVLNLPATVELATPNVFADQIEWFDRNVAGRDAFVLSIHPHNDRGTAVAAAELALMAGAERIEGTLFGNGERTGNVDIVTLALNLLTQGVDPALDLSNVPEIVRTVEYCNRLPVPQRHPYGGELVFTAFSGSHQDAIKKGFAARAAAQSEGWDIPYLPIDPHDVGRTYETVIRINSQSGKGGVAYLMQHDYGFDLPRALQVEFGKTVQALSESGGGEIESPSIFALFEREYLNRCAPLCLDEYRVAEGRSGLATLDATISDHSIARTLQGRGNGPIDAFVAALGRDLGIKIAIRDYHEHAVGRGADAVAIAYVEVTVGAKTYFGVGRDRSIVTASLRAILAGVNRALANEAFRRETVPAHAEGNHATLAV